MSFVQYSDSKNTQHGTKRTNNDKTINLKNRIKSKLV